MRSTPISSTCFRCIPRIRHSMRSVKRKHISTTQLEMKGQLLLPKTSPRCVSLRKTKENSSPCTTKKKRFWWFIRIVMEIDIPSHGIHCPRKRCCNETMLQLETHVSVGPLYKSMLLALEVGRWLLYIRIHYSKHHLFIPQNTRDSIPIMHVEKIGKWFPDADRWNDSGLMSLRHIHTHRFFLFFYFYCHLQSCSILCTKTLPRTWNARVAREFLLRSPTTKWLGHTPSAPEAQINLTTGVASLERWQNWIPCLQKKNKGGWFIESSCLSCVFFSRFSLRTRNENQNSSPRPAHTISIGFNRPTRFVRYYHTINRPSRSTKNLTWSAIFFLHYNKSTPWIWVESRPCDILAARYFFLVLIFKEPILCMYLNTIENHTTRTLPR